MNKNFKIFSPKKLARLRQLKINQAKDNSIQTHALISKKSNNSKSEERTQFLIFLENNSTTNGRKKGVTHFYDQQENFIDNEENLDLESAEFLKIYENL
jgi:hypothetical protein